MASQSQNNVLSVLSPFKWRTRGDVFLADPHGSGRHWSPTYPVGFGRHSWSLFFFFLHL